MTAPDKPRNPYIHEHPTPEPPQTIEEARELHRQIAEGKKINGFLETNVIDKEG